MTPEIVLPNELSACHELIAELAATVAEQQAKLEAQRLEIDYLLKLAFRRRSERYLDNPDQLTLDLGEIPEVQDAVDGLKEALAEAQPDAEPQAAARSRKPPRKPRNEQLPAHLPRYEVTAEIPEEQRHCAEHGERVVIGYDRVETLEFTPPKLQVRVTLYPKLICVGAPQCGVQSPERKAGLVEGNRYDTSVAAEIITAKYGYHLPIYRQQDCFAESGWTPGRSTLLNIACGAAALALPLIRYFADCVRTDWGVGTDDTGVTLVFKSIPPIDPANPRSQRIHEVLTAAREKGEQSITAKMWVYRGMDVPLNVFDFTVSRHRDGPDEFLVDTDYTGTMMADCYSGYQKISLRSEGRLSRAACNSRAPTRSVGPAQGVQCA